MKKRYFSEELPFNKKTFIKAVLMAFVYAIVFYLFLYFLREGTRYLFNLKFDDGQILVNSKQETNYYNFISALLASIFGLAQLIRFLFHKPHPFKNRFRNYRKFEILNNVNLLPLLFLYICIKVLLGLIFVFKNTTPKEVSVPSIGYIGYLIFVVLFLELWKGIRLVYKNRALKWMFYSFVIVVLFAFSISRIEFYHFREMNINLVEKQPEFRYNITYPISEKYFDSNFCYVIPVHVGYDKFIDREDIKPSLVFYRKEIDMEEFRKVIGKGSSVPYTIKMFTDNITKFVILAADKDMSIHYINRLKDTLASHGYKRVGYRVTPKDAIFKQEYYYNMYVNDIMLGPKYKLRLMHRMHAYKKIKITILRKDSVQINDKLSKNINEKLYPFIKENGKDGLIDLRFGEHTTLNDYLVVKNLILDNYNKARNQYALQKYKLNLDDLIENYKHNSYYKMYPEKNKNVSTSKQLKEKITEIKNKYPILINYNHTKYY